MAVISRVSAYIVGCYYFVNEYPVTVESRSDDTKGMNRHDSASYGFYSATLNSF